MGVRLCLANETGRPLTALADLAEQIFGNHARPAGWFARKLEREAVDPTVSVVAIDADARPVAYLLVGHEPGEPWAYGAGIGVLPQFRGHGVATALLRTAAEVLADRGRQQLHLLAEPPLVEFYRHHGLVEVHRQHTLLALANGPRDLDFAAHPPAAWAVPGHPVAAWRQGPWTRTARTMAATLTLLGPAIAHVSREGRAILVQHLCVGGTDASLARALLQTHALAAAADLRRNFITGTPVLLYGCDAVSCVTAALLAEPAWRVVQTAHVMALTL